jgi:hypothetical protein
MKLATLLIFSGIDQDGACDMLLPQVRFDTSAKVVIFHGMCVFVRAFVKKLVCLQLVLRSRKCEPIHPLPHTSSCGVVLN